MVHLLAAAADKDAKKISSNRDKSIVTITALSSLDELMNVNQHRFLADIPVEAARAFIRTWYQERFRILFKFGFLINKKSTDQCVKFWSL